MFTEMTISIGTRLVCCKRSFNVNLCTHSWVTNLDPLNSIIHVNIIRLIRLNSLIRLFELCKTPIEVLSCTEWITMYYIFQKKTSIFSELVFSTVIPLCLCDHFPHTLRCKSGNLDDWTLCCWVVGNLDDWT